MLLSRFERIAKNPGGKLHLRCVACSKSDRSCLMGQVIKLGFASWIQSNSVLDGTLSPLPKFYFYL